MKQLTARQPFNPPWKYLETERLNLGPGIARVCDPKPGPYCTVSGLAYDRTGHFPIIWRSDLVRSAKLAWSIPSGLHEVGFTVFEQFGIELHEELGLEPLIETGVLVGQYENIAQVDGYHWVINVQLMEVETLDNMTNKEPDKHPKIEKIHCSLLAEDKFWEGHGAWTPGLREFLYPIRFRLRDTITRMTEVGRSPVNPTRS
jgi:ADP-ribose pyrophosphatase YjhB (NUDIX family)